MYEHCGNGPVGMSDASGMLPDWFPGATMWGGITCLLNTGIDSIANSVGGSNSVCAILTQCGCAFFASLVTAAVDSISGGLSIVATGCISGLLASACSEISSGWCDSLCNCPNKESIKCRIFGFLAGTIGGCIGGMLGNRFSAPVDAWIANMMGLEFGLGDSSGMDAACSFLTT